MMLGMGLFWIAAILGLLFLVHDIGEDSQRPPEETALTILDRRFAEGAVSPDEYPQRRGVLTGAGIGAHTDGASTVSGRSQR